MSTITVRRRLKRPAAIATVAGLALLAVPTMSVLSVADAALPAGCSQPGLPGNTDIVCLYDTAGEHSFVVPTGVTSLVVDVIGAKGGDGTGTNPATTTGHGGQGDQVGGTITVTAGATI